MHYGTHMAHLLRISFRSHLFIVASACRIDYLSQRTHTWLEATATAAAEDTSGEVALDFLTLSRLWVRASGTGKFSKVRDTGE